MAKNLMDKEALTEFVRSRVWYQRFRFPYDITVGQMDCTEKWRRMQMPRDFEGHSVLDLGCYMGWYCFQAKRQGAGRVLGVDINKKFVEGAKTIRDQIFLLEDVEFKVADMEQLGLDTRFDYVLLLSTLHRIDGTQPPHYTPINRQITILNKVVEFCDNVFVLEYCPHGSTQKDFLETKFPIVEDLGPSITPEWRERRILKCRRH